LSISLENQEKISTQFLLIEEKTQQSTTLYFSTAVIIMQGTLNKAIVMTTKKNTSCSFT
jgi:hypothetical protein